MAEKELTGKNFTEIIEGEKPVLVDFWAPWCGPCQMMGQIVDELAKEEKDVVVGKLNIDDHPDVAVKYHVMSVPTFLMFKDGKVSGQVVGAVPKEALISMIKKVTEKS
ncbi:MAG: thioredoxin [Candidatus Berkelbacteria bacterium]|nr:thioredoxin [Candidatus Berkelbacteria bacterium]